MDTENIQGRQICFIYLCNPLILNTYIVIAGLHLIPNSKIPALQDNIRLEYAHLLFKKNGIPDLCHFSLISELGFDITGKKRWNDYSNAIIVKRKGKKRKERRQN